MRKDEIRVSLSLLTDEGREKVDSDLLALFCIELDGRPDEPEPMYAMQTIIKSKQSINDAERASERRPINGSLRNYLRVVTN